MQILRADTQVVVHLGTFVDVTDGFTPQTDILLSGNEAELLKHNSTATVDISGRTWAAVTNCRGWYNLTLTTADTDTEGLLTVIVQDDSDCLPVYTHFMVVNANVYDSLYGTAAADYLKVKNDAGATIPATAMRGTDNAALAASYTATRAGYLDELAAANLPADLDLVLADTNELELDWKNGGRLDLLLDGASSAGDPWLTEIPGAYATGSAGKKIADLYQAFTGNWEITGNQLILYASDGTTALYTYNLTRDGEATEFNPKKREVV